MMPAIITPLFLPDAKAGIFDQWEGNLNLLKWH